MEILTLGIVGAFVTALVQVLKNKLTLEKDETLLLVAGLSVVAGLGYYFIERADLLQPMITILGIATTIYAFLVKRFEE